MKPISKTAHELSSMIRAGKTSSVEICREILSVTEKREETVNAYITLSNDIMVQAEAADKAIAEGKSIHPLAGIPIAVKDNISVKGIPATCGSKMLSNYIPPYDASVIEKIKDAGMVITGKTNMDEFAMGTSTETSFFGATRNPYNWAYSPGGSSGGSGAAVAAGEAIIALGSDTGGSVRQPAAFCGLTGLKPTYCSVSRYGLIAFASSLEQIGPMAKDVTDTAMLYSLICGRDRMDATTALREYPDFAKNLSSDISGLRIGVPKEYFGEFVSDEVKEAVYGGIKLFEAKGAVVRMVSLPMTKYAVNAYYILSSAEASSNLARYDGVRYGFRTEGTGSLTEMYERTRSEGFGDEVKRRIMLGTYALSAGYYDEYYNRARNARQMIGAELTDTFKEYDVLITPTYPTAPFMLSESDDRLSRYVSDICTVPANLSGIPALTIPCGFDAQGLPIGMQLMGNHFTEQKLFNVGFAFERFSDREYTGGKAE